MRKIRQLNNTLKTPDLAVFLATSGHSGVDRVMGNLLTELGRRGLRIDLLRVAGHGPCFKENPAGLRLVELGHHHVNSCFFALRRYLSQNRPKVLLSDKDRLNRLALLAAVGLPTRVCVRVGTTVSSNLRNRNLFERTLQLGSMRFLYPRAEAVILPSRAAAADLQRLAGLPPAKLKVLPSPIIDQRLIELSRREPETAWPAVKGPLLLGVGELSRRKDFATAIRALADIRRDFAEARLLILGDGRERSKLLALARQLGLEEAVRLPGFSPNPYAWMVRADLFILSSHYEGAPVALIEALGCGTPVIASDAPGGSREIIENSGGSLFAVGDADDLARVALMSLKNPPDKQKLMTAGAPYQVPRAADAYLAALNLKTNS